MPTDESSPQESSGHRQRYRSPTDSPTTTVLVLEKAILKNRFHDGAVAAVCPDCGEVIDRWKSGLPNPLTRFQTDCPDCGQTLRRWSAVVMPDSRTETVLVDVLRAIVQDYWDDQFRVGVEDDTLPHTREFARETETLAEEWNWRYEVSCPLCDRSLSDLSANYLDYHHWIYRDDVGTSICRDCHDYLHGGDKSTANTQDWEAKELGLRDFRDLTTIRLAERDRAIHDPPADRDDPVYAERLKERYNLPLNQQRINHLVSEVRFDDDISERVENAPATPEKDSKTSGSIPVRQL